MLKPKYSLETLKLSKDIVNNCIGCKKCMEECVMMNDFGENPKDIFEGFLKEENIDPLIPYSCNLCSKCVMVCPKKLRISEVFMGIRQSLVKANNGKYPLKGYTAVSIHQILSFGFMNIFTTRRKQK